MDKNQTTPNIPNTAGTENNKTYSGNLKLLVAGYVALLTFLLIGIIKCSKTMDNKYDNAKKSVKTEIQHTR